MPPVRALDYLTEADKAEARRVGKARYKQAIELGRSQPYGDPGTDQRLFIDCYSSLAELVVANYLGLPWTALVDDLTTKPPDVGSRVEVRWSPRPGGHLIGHDDDTDGWVMVSVRGQLPGMAIMGWTTVTTMKQEHYRNHPKARNPTDFWMPIEELMMPELLWQMRGDL